MHSPNLWAAIAVGETWSQLTAKLLSQECVREIRAKLEPVQVCAGTPGGAEALVHLARQWLHRNKDNTNKVTVSLDSKNAFNSLGRSALLHAARR